ncbi:MAG: AAA family ATPase [Nitrospira sp.]|nr:AAA family ATPase [Nitrospira sp.]
MRLKRFSLQNARSFMERQDLFLDGDISILIGPNGGGKTNLLDAVVVLLRRYLFASMWPAHAPTAENPDRYEFRSNDVLNQMMLERHALAPRDLQQVMEVVVEVSDQDVQNMVVMQRDAPRLLDMSSSKYTNIRLGSAINWNLNCIHPGQQLTYRIENGGLSHDESAATTFLQYLQFFEIDSALRDEYELAPLATPMIYLPVNRSASGFPSTIQLANFNSYEQKRLADASYSRSSPSLIPLAIGRLAQKYRLLLEKDKGNAAEEFYGDPALKTLGELLSELGYQWLLETINPMRNEYDVRLKKQGSSFLVSAASSGERELLTYMFAIFALNVRDALIVVDEPELHLHPKWQQALLQLFVRLSAKTGNQFLLATHSPTFVGPDSIQYVSRVYSQDQKSRLVRLNSTALPDNRHLFNIVNSQNNERIFFADKVILVEGLSDRILFERVLDQHGRSEAVRPSVEVVAVGGKGLFAAYKAVLDACKIDCALIADQDYLEQIGTEAIKNLFVTNARDIKQDVIDNIKSLDGAALVAAIESAIATGNWDGARAVWEYIKGRRRRLRENLDPEEEASLKSFITGLRKQGIFVLRRGPLEAYLPEGYRSKDIEKLIRFVRGENFWKCLDPDVQNELKEIATLSLQ